jgi:hypothetical protein
MRSDEYWYSLGLITNKNNFYPSTLEPEFL